VRQFGKGNSNLLFVNYLYLYPDRSTVPSIDGTGHLVSVLVPVVHMPPTMCAVPVLLSVLSITDGSNLHSRMIHTIEH
jgi:hypothetical protein